MSSSGAANTARPSRDEGYKMILPTIPSGTVALNTIFLHADPSGRPYNIGHFGEALQAIVTRSEVTSIGPFLYNHLWALTFDNPSARDKLLSLGEIPVKGKKCLIIDPHKKELRVKMHWLPQHVPDEAVVAALERFGSVTDIVREKWKDTFFEGAETTTRQIVLTLKKGVTAENLPHQMFICGCQALVAVPGRPPLCLRCKAIGHIRRQCHTPWCKKCRRFGHEEDECVITYASRVRQQQDSHVERNDMEFDDDSDSKAGASSSPLNAAPVTAVACVPVVPAPDPGGDGGGQSARAAEPPCNRGHPTSMDATLPPSTTSPSGPHCEDTDCDPWVTPKRKKGRKSPPPSMPLRITEVDHSALDDIGFLSA